MGQGLLIIGIGLRWLTGTTIIHNFENSMNTTYAEGSLEAQCFQLNFNDDTLYTMLPYVKLVMISGAILRLVLFIASLKWPKVTRLIFYL